MKDMLKYALYVIMLMGFLPVLISCEDKLEKEVVTTWPDGSPQKVYLFEKKGEIRVKVREERFYENGNREMVGEFTNNQKSGEWNYWFEDGRKWSKGSYKNGLRDGEAIVWRSNGFKTYEGSYSAGKPHGSWIFYDVDGSRLKEVRFEYGKKASEIAYKEGIPFNMPEGDSIVLDTR